MPRRATCAGFSRVMSSPLKWIVPRVGARNLVSMLKTVVLPAPLGPIKPWITPLRTFSDTSLTAMNPSNSFARFLVSRMQSSIGLWKQILCLAAADGKQEVEVEEKSLGSSARGKSRRVEAPGIAVPTQDRHYSMWVVSGHD